MRTVLITNDLVRLSFAQAALRSEGLEAHVLDAAMSAVDGSIGALPRRLAVAPRDEAAARQVLAALGIEPSDG